MSLGNFRIGQTFFPIQLCRLTLCNRGKNGKIPCIFLVYQGIQYISPFHQKIERYG